MAKAVKTGFAASKFLTPAERQTVSAYFSRRHDVAIAIDGGFDGAERTRAVFTNPDWGGYNRDELLAALKISYRPQDTLGHRDILDSLYGRSFKKTSLEKGKQNDNTT